MAASGAASSIASMMVRLGVDPKALFVGLARATNAILAFKGKVGGLAAAGSAIGIGFGVAIANVIDEAREFQDTFTNVAKTVAGDAKELEPKLGDLARQFQRLSTTIPMTTTEINRVGEIAGQLAVPIDFIETFTKTMLGVGVATNLSAEEASMAMAKLLNVTGMGYDQIENLSSALVQLGNTSATTERDIVNFAVRMAPAAKQVQLTADQVLAFSASISELGILTEAGATAISRAIVDMSAAVSRGGTKLAVMADTAQMSVEDFSTAFREKPAEAIHAFLRGLGELGVESGKAFLRLAQLGSTFVGQRVRNTLLALAGASDKLKKHLADASSEMLHAQALSNEFNRRLGTLTSNLQMLGNSYVRIKQHIGSIFIPSLTDATKAIKKVVDRIGDWTEGSTEWEDSTKKMSVKLGLVTVGVTTLIGTFSLLIGALQLVSKAISVVAVLRYASIWGLVAVGIGTFVSQVIKYWDDIVMGTKRATASVVRGASIVAEAIAYLTGWDGLKISAAAWEEWADSVEESAFRGYSAATSGPEGGKDETGPKPPEQILEEAGIEWAQMMGEHVEAIASAIQGLAAIDIKAPKLKWDEEQIRDETIKLLEKVFTDLPFEAFENMPPELQDFLDLLNRLKDPINTLQKDLSHLETIWQLNGKTLEYVSNVWDRYDTEIQSLSRNMDKHGATVVKLTDEQAAFARSFDVVGLSIDNATSELTSFSSAEDQLKAVIKGIQDALPILAKMYGLNSQMVAKWREELEGLQLQLKAMGEIKTEVSLGEVTQNFDKSIRGAERLAAAYWSIGEPFDLLEAKASEYRSALQEIYESNTIDKNAEDVKNLLVGLQNLRNVQKVFNVIEGSIDSVANSITSTFDQSLEGIINGTVSVEQAFANLGRNIALMWAKTMVNMAVKSAARWAKEKVLIALSKSTKAAADQAEVASHLAKETEKTGITAAGTATREELTWWEATSAVLAKWWEKAEWLGTEIQKTAISIWGSVQRNAIQMWEFAQEKAGKLAETALWIMTEGWKAAVTWVTNTALWGQVTALWAVIAPLVASAAKWLLLAAAQMISAIMGAAASAAQIPYIGWVLAIVAAATLGGILGAYLSSAAKGGVLGEDTLLFAHKKEMILPPDLSVGLQNMIRGKGFSSDDYIGELGIAGPTETREAPITFIIQAADSKDVKRLFMRNGPALAKAGRKQFRNFNKDTRIPRKRG